MGNFLSLPLLAILAILEASFVPQIRLLGGGPQLVFLMVLAWAINNDLEDGVIWAFVGGIMLDLLSAVPLGTSTFGMVLIVFAISGLGQQVYRIGPILLIGLVLFGTLFYHITTTLLLAINGFTINWLTNLTFVTAPTIFYNLVFIVPIYWFANRLRKRLNRKNRFSIE